MSRARTALLVAPAVVLVLAVLGAGVGSALLASLGLLPVAGEPSLSVTAYRSVLPRPELREAVAVTLWVATASTAAAAAVGLVVAVLITRSRLGGRLLRAAAALTIPVPHLVGAAAVGLLLADSGLLARALGVPPGSFPGLVAGPAWLAVIAEYAWKESAFVAVVVVGALAADEPQLREAAATLGAGWWQQLRRVTLPLAAPALVLSGGISFAYVVGSYEVAWLLGRTSPEPLPLLAYRLFTDIDLTTRPEAMAVALVTTGLAAAALMVTLPLLRRTTVRR